MKYKKTLILFLLLATTSFYCQTILTASVVGIKDGDTVVVFRQFKQPNYLKISKN